jgi:hypothetical protein
MTRVKTAAARAIMRDYLAENPYATATHLAEEAAINLDHDEWLDIETHWIWDLALEEWDQHDAQRQS